MRQRRPGVACLRADAQLSAREARLALAERLAFPLEIDDDGSEYFRASPDTTLDLHVEDPGGRFPLVLTVWHWRGEAEAKTAAEELGNRIGAVTGWAVVAAE
ncbi:hypothetical protein [Agreia sp. COWG]|uniref:hypothetical protein n=1 Tax=Agreia sp. COWG TaxID=2773266 RepID=UPI001927F06C|nr:hypothetical protein [Agreia sp. COWG]CAD6001495.1 conserved protein of unknown function [Agreia sp. COWG]